MSAAVLIVVISGGCAIDLQDDDVAGRPCKNGECLDGYHCEQKICVLNVASGGAAGTGGSTDLDAMGFDASGGSTFMDAPNGTGAADAFSGADVDASDTDAAPAPSVACRDLVCSGGDFCCVSQFPGYPNLPSPDSFSCVASTTSCEYVLRCDGDHDCPAGEVCCSSQTMSGWVASCRPSTDCDSPAVRIGCTLPQHCGEGLECCGTWSSLVSRLTNIECRSGCSDFSDRRLCEASLDCGTMGQCVETASLPGFHVCQ